MRVIHVRASLPCGRPSRNVGRWGISVPGGISREKGYASALRGVIFHFSKTPRGESGHFPRLVPVLWPWDRISSSSEIFPLSGKWELSSGAAPSRLALQAETSPESCVSGHTSLCSSWGFTLVNDSESPNMKRPLTDFHQRTQLNSYERIKNQSQPPETACESNTTQLSNNNQRTGNSFMGSWANKENTKQL